jgi:L-rhamnose mutarotase
MRKSRVFRMAVMHGVLLAGVVLAMGCSSSPPVQRYASVIGVKAETLDEYKALHANPWPEINAKLKQVNIQNYSIYLTQFPDGNHYLFGYFEYTGTDFDADMKQMADDPKTKEWWSHTDPMQLPLENRDEGEWWKSLEEVYRLD